MLGNPALIYASHPLKVQVHGIGVGDMLSTPRFDGDQLRSQLIGKPRNDLVLHVEKVGHGFIKALGPEVRASRRVDELNVDAHPIA